MEVIIDHYEILGLPSGKLRAEISDQDIARAYRTKAKELHPDKCRDNPDAHANFQKLQSSYEILKDEKARKLFDDGLRAKRKRERHEPQYESKRRKMVSELHKRERDSAFNDHKDPEEERTRKKLQEELARIRAKRANEVAAKERRQKRGSLPCAEKPRMKEVSDDLVGAAGHEAFESYVLGRALRYAAAATASST